ncbi:LamG domain-containing protein [Emticicia sp. BO119]|uniref:LamG domain-containing protein n=1 Tax=Emticicia sp. BO119 TaxID=2757768 RepID=UPI0015F02620|nr:LamG domain-containing protein [Emticicia sp. BO119]MBA4852719.1 LamG domain-containing protein [Emticicia sp. BO119]
MKKLLTLLSLLGIISAHAQQKRPINPIPNMVADANYRIGCSLFADPNNYSTGSSFSFSAPVNNNSYLTGPNGADYGCLYSAPNQAWFMITVNTGGNLYFNFANSYDYDIDAAIWGPINNNDVANACASTLNSPLTCDFDGSRPDLYINNAQAGQKYLMLVTNYSNANTTINITQPNGGSVTYAMVNLPNCSLIPTATLTGASTTITEGQSATLNLSFTGSSPWNYSLSDGTIGTTYTSPININVYPTSSQTYTINSVSNLCGTNSGSGSVGISVLRNILMKSCFPLDGNITDSKGLNSGTLQNGVLATTNRHNEINKALQFDGTNDYISITADQLNNTTFSFATWVKLDELPTSINAEEIIFSLGGSSDEHYLGVEYYNGAPSWKFSSNNSKVYSTAIVDTEWHLLIGVRTGGLLKLYVDGVMTASTFVSGTATYSNPLSGRIGGGIANTKFWKGKIDDIKIFNSSLLDPEVLILQNYNNCNDVFLDTYISVQSISTSLICTNTSFTIRAFTNSLTPETGTPFVVELSDESGSFDNPTIIGSSEFLPLTANIPNTVTGGSHKLRIRYGAIISINTFDIYVNKSANYNVTGTTTINDGQSANISLNFTGSGPWNYVLSNGLSGAATTSPWVIPVTPDQSATYSVISAQNVCGNAILNGSNSATITVNFTKQNVTCLPFNGNATDQKANNTTTVNGALLTENRYGQTNAAYTFDGTSNYIEYTTNLLRKREYTMSAWVLANNITGGTQYILSQGETGTQTFQGLALTNSGWQFTSYNSWGAYYATSTTGLVANQWVHLTAVRTYQQLKLYVNGNLVATSYSTDNIPFKTSDIGRIGASSSGLSNYFNGKIDDVRLYKGALNDEEVYALYANTGNCPTIENSSVILVKSLSPSTVCAGGTISVTYASSGINPTMGAPLKVQLSDQNGSFANPTIVGSGISSPIVANIPFNSQNGSLYKIRIISSGENPVTSLTTASLNISGELPTATLSGGGNIPYGGSTSLTITFTGSSPWTYAINNGSNQTTSTNPLTVSVSPTVTTTYTITSLTNHCGAGTTIGSAVIAVNSTIILGSTNTNFCEGQTISVPFTLNFSPSATLRLELSDSTGSFTNPLVLGTGTSSPISALIPASITGGTRYKVRIVSTSPVAISSVSDNILLKKKPTAAISGTKSIIEDFSADLTITFTGIGPWTYKINNGTNQTATVNPTIASVSPTTNATYAVTSVSNACGNGTVSGNAIITVTHDAYLVSCYPFNGNANDSKGINNGVTYGGVSLTTDRFNTANSAYLFDGFDDYIQLPINRMGNMSAYSVSLWVSTTGYAHPNGENLFTVIPNGIDGTMHSLIFTNWDVNIEQTQAFYRIPCGNFSCQTWFSQTFTPNTWYNIVVTRQGSALRLYSNGVLLSSVTQTGTNFDATMDNLMAFLGKKFREVSGGDGGYFRGKIDDVQIYKRALNDTQVTALFRQTSCDDIVALPFVNLVSVSTSTMCKGQNVTIQYSAQKTAALIKAELSDANGNFATPIVIGSGTGSPIVAQIPANQGVGAGYKIRLVSTDNTPVVSNFSQTLSVNSVSTASLTGNTTINEGESTNLTVNFTGSAPWTYKINNGTNQTTSTNPLSVTISPITNTTYNITSLSNACGNGTTNGSVSINVLNLPFLISCYSFNGNMTDGKGNNNGTLLSSAYTTDRFNNSNGALIFDGNGTNYGEIPLDELSNMTAYTVSLWFSIPTHESFMYGRNLFALMPPYNTQEPAQSITEAEWLSSMTNFGEEVTKITYGNSYNGFFSDAFIVNLNTWYHVVLTRQNNVIKLYQNGVLLNTKNAVTGNAYLGNLKGYIGRRFGSGSENALGDGFKGKLDDLQIYRNALSAGQVQALYKNNTSACFDASKFTCLADVVYDSMINGQQVLSVKNQITGIGIIQAGANIYFDAKNAVLLQPGFKTETNTIFTAKAGTGCID